MLDSLDSQVAQRAAAVIQHRLNDNTKVIFLAPLPEQVPDDGMLKFVAVNSVYDFASIPSHAVAMFDVAEDAELLRLVVEHAHLLGLEPRVLVGLPSAEYTRVFDEIVWPCDKVAYAPLLSELSIAAEAAAQAQSDSMTRHDHERAQFTRRDGSVRVDERIQLASDMVPAPAEDHDEEEDVAI